jgi:predicted transcriptional regulator
MSVASRRAKGSLESEVLAALWAAGSPLTAADVVDAVGGDLAYNTVQTILARLHAKGAVRRELTGRAHAYTPVLDDAGLAANRMQAMLDKGGDHAAVLARFLHTLAPEDEATLAALLADRDEADDGADPGAGR